MQNEAVAPTIPFTIVHGNTELCCVIKHCLKITNVKNQMRMNAYVLIRPTGISVQDLVSAPRCQGNISGEKRAHRSNRASYHCRRPVARRKRRKEKKKKEKEKKRKGEEDIE